MKGPRTGQQFKSFWGEVLKRIILNQLVCIEHAWYFFFPEEKPQDSGKMANAAFGLMRKVSSGNFFKAAPEPATKAETTDPIQAQEEKSSSSTPQLTKKSSMSQLFSDAQQVWELMQHFLFCHWSITFAQEDK